VKSLRAVPAMFSSYVKGVFCVLWAITSMGNLYGIGDPDTCERLPLSKPFLTIFGSREGKKVSDDFVEVKQLADCWEQKVLHLRATDKKAAARFAHLMPLQRVKGVLTSLVHLQDLSTEVSGGGDDAVKVRGIPTLEDIKVLKRIRGEDGAYWSGVIPIERLIKEGTSQLNADLIEALFSRKNFSLLVNKVNFRDQQIGRLAENLSRDFSGIVNVNMYLTPPYSQAFEAHWDPMETIILQVHGRKTWSIWEGGVALGRYDMKYKPKQEEIGTLLQRIDLRQGDILYIPSGTIHEAACEGSGLSMHLTIGVDIPDTCLISGVFHRALSAISDEQIAEHMRTAKIKSKNDNTDDNNNKNNYSDNNNSPPIILRDICHLVLALIATEKDMYILRKQAPSYPPFSSSDYPANTCLRFSEIPEILVESLARLSGRLSDHRDYIEERVSDFISSTPDTGKGEDLPLGASDTPKPFPDYLQMRQPLLRLKKAYSNASGMSNIGGDIRSALMLFHSLLGSFAGDSKSSNDGQSGSLDDFTSSSNPLLSALNWSKEQCQKQARLHGDSHKQARLHGGAHKNDHLA